MHIIIADNYQELSEKAARLVLNQLAIKPDSVFGFATGSTPLGMYAELINARRRYGYDFSRVTTFNLDEYAGLDKTHPHSYRRFMEKNFFSGVNIKKSNINIPVGAAANMAQVCAAYEQKIQRHPIDLQVLGIGANGHIGFNEPGSAKTSLTRLVTLTRQTRADNARFFGNADTAPAQAITMGIKTILSAKKIVLLASGKNKARAVRQMVEGSIGAACPASFLREHNDVYVILDKEAAALLKHAAHKKNGWSDIVILNQRIIPRAKTVLVISPHHDDSAVSCGATIKALSRHNTVHTLVMTAGHRAVMSAKTRPERVRVRNREALAEGAVLGARTIFGNFAFYDFQKKYWQQDLKKLASIWKKIQPDIVLLPHTYDEHPTHALSTLLALDYLKRGRAGAVELWHYEGLWSQHLLASINIVFGFGKELLAVKNRALNRHRSQITRLPLVGASESLARFRALTIPEQRFVSFGQVPPRVADYIEAYYRVVL